MTPFEDFYLRVRDLVDSDAGRQLGNLYPDHPIYTRLTHLFDATNSMSISYGMDGPRESWNRPSRSAGSSFSGSSHSNSPRPSTPININSSGGLHPNWSNTPPPSRPGSWDALNKIKNLEADKEKLELEVETLKQKLDRYVEDLKWFKEENKRLDDENKGVAKTNKQKLELEKQIDVHEATIERLRNRCADAFTELKDYKGTASEFEQLVIIKQDEQKVKSRLKDESGKQDAQDAELYYNFQQGQALANAEQDPKAEQILADTLDAKIRLGSQRAPKVDSHKVQTLLCDVLCRQGKTSKAKKLYYKAADALEYGEMNPRDKSGCTWVLQNAISYAHLLVKEGSYDRAFYWLDLIWSHRHTMTSTGLRDLEKAILRTVDILETRDDSEPLLKLLQKICDEHNPSNLSSSVLFCLAKLGTLLHYRGRPDVGHPRESSLHDHAKAIHYLRQAWTERNNLDRSAGTGVGWGLALSLMYLKKHGEAKDVLVELLSELGNAAAPAHITEDQVSTLLAYTYLTLGELHSAQSSARVVFKRHGSDNIFDGMTSSCIDFSLCHQADTLIQALSKQTGVYEDRRTRFQEAEEAWLIIYKARDEILSSDKSRKPQLLKHIKSAKILAEENDAAAKKKGFGKSERAKKVRVQIAEIEKKIR